MLSRLVGLFVHCLHSDDNQGSWSGKDSIHYVKSKRIEKSKVSGLWIEDGDLSARMLMKLSQNMIACVFNPTPIPPR